ncbi:hypothetical protein [Hyphomicrobium sp.]|jgi:hypothetical protein|uniref:hypothetical protein n=1 Tax=Hyphomicrobium sp. TaxID=82 RepID=UPI003569F648
MFARFCFGLIAVIGAVSAAMAAESAPTKIPIVPQAVPGGDVTIEGGVRVIRPASPEADLQAVEQADSRGSLIYRGAAFYRVPSPTPPKSGHSEAGKDSAKPSEQ